MMMQVIGDAFVVFGGVMCMCSVCGVISYIVDIIQAKLDADAKNIAERRTRHEDIMNRRKREHHDFLKMKRMIEGEVNE